MECTKKRECDEKGERPQTLHTVLMYSSFVQYQTLGPLSTWTETEIIIFTFLQCAKCFLSLLN